MYLRFSIIQFVFFFYSQQNRNLRDKMKSESNIVVLRNGSGKSLMLLHCTYLLLVILDCQFRRILSIYVLTWVKHIFHRVSLGGRQMYFSIPLETICASNGASFNPLLKFYRDRKTIIAKAPPWVFSSPLASCSPNILYSLLSQFHYVPIYQCVNKFLLCIHYSYREILQRVGPW